MFQSSKRNRPTQNLKNTIERKKIKKRKIAESISSVTSMYIYFFSFPRFFFQTAHICPEFKTHNLLEPMKKIITFTRDRCTDYFLERQKLKKIDFILDFVLTYCLPTPQLQLFFKTFLSKIFIGKKIGSKFALYNLEPCLLMLLDSLVLKYKSVWGEEMKIKKYRCSRSSVFWLNY